MHTGYATDDHLFWYVKHVQIPDTAEYQVSNIYSRTRVLQSKGIYILQSPVLNHSEFSMCIRLISNLI